MGETSSSPTPRARTRAEPAGSKRGVVVLEAATGKKLETWTVPNARALCHGLAAEPDGSVLVINSTTGQLVRLGRKGVVRESAALGEGVAEASLPE